MNSEFVFIQAGHTVTVYERNDRVGGLLRYGIPTMKLSKQVRVISSLPPSLYSVLQNPHHETEQTGEWFPPSLPLFILCCRIPTMKLSKRVRVLSSLPPFLSLFCAAESPLWNWANRWECFSRSLRLSLPPPIPLSLFTLHCRIPTIKTEQTGEGFFTPPFLPLSLYSVSVIRSLFVCAVISVSVSLCLSAQTY